MVSCMSDFQRPGGCATTVKNGSQAAWTTNPPFLDHKLDIRYFSYATHKSAATDYQRCITPAQRSFNAQAGDGARDYELLDLLCAFEDVMNLGGMPKPALWQPT